MTLDDFKPLIEWIQANPHFAGSIIFLISFLESVAIVGLLFPGALIMPAIGTLVGSHLINPFLALFLAAGGAFCGDTVSFWLGYHFKTHIRERWPFRNYPAVLHSGQVFFKKHGKKSIFLGRFIGLMRPITPLIAGMMHMPPLRFILTSFIACLLWAPTYMFPGIVIGAVSLYLPPHAAHRFIAMLLLGFIAALIGTWIIKSTIDYISNAIYRCLDFLWTLMGKFAALRWLKKALQDPARPHDHHQLVLAFYFLVCAISFIALTRELTQGSPLMRFNHTVVHFFYTLRTPLVDKFMIAITLLGEAYTQIALLIAVFVALWVQKAQRTAFYWLGNALLAFIVTHKLKVFFDITRPFGVVHLPSGAAFPSGHATLSTTIFGFLFVILVGSLPQHRKKLLYVLLPSIALISFSRIYLGVHWTSDVVGGILLGLSTVLLSTLCYHRGPVPKIYPWPVILVGVCALLGTWTILMITSFSTLQYDYSLLPVIQYQPLRKWWSYLL